MYGLFLAVQADGSGAARVPLAAAIVFGFAIGLLLGRSVAQEFRLGKRVSESTQLLKSLTMWAIFTVAGVLITSFGLGRYELAWYLLGLGCGLVFSFFFPFVPPVLPADEISRMAQLTEIEQRSIKGVARKLPGDSDRNERLVSFVSDPDRAVTASGRPADQVAAEVEESLDAIPEDQIEEPE